MKSNKKLDEAISRLADMIENGQLMASMNPIGFLNAVADKLEKQNQPKFEIIEFCQASGCIKLSPENTCTTMDKCVKSAEHLYTWLLLTNRKITKDDL